MITGCARRFIKMVLSSTISNRVKIRFIHVSVPVEAPRNGCDKQKFLGKYAHGRKIANTRWEE